MLAELEEQGAWRARFGVTPAALAPRDGGIISPAVRPIGSIGLELGRWGPAIVFGKGGAGRILLFFFGVVQGWSRAFLSLLFGKKK